MAFTMISAPALERNAKGKKMVKPFFPIWKNGNEYYPKEAYSHMYKDTDKVKIVLTGEISDTTVFDFDAPGSYEACIEKYPEMKEAYTVKTPRGYHIYTKYNKDYKTTSNVDIGIDVRNDNALAFGNGTVTEYASKYTLLDNAKKLDLEMPKAFYDTINPVKKAVKTKMKLVLQKTAVVKVDKFSRDVVKLINKDIINKMENFRRIVWAMKYEGFTVSDVKEVATKSDLYEAGTFDTWFQETKLWEARKTKTPCKLATLIHYAKESDKSAFYDLYVKSNTTSECDTSDIGLAQIYLDILGDNLFYQDKNIYIFLEDEWSCDKEGHFVKKNFFEEMGKYYHKLKKHLDIQINTIENEEGKEDETEELLNRLEEIKTARRHIRKVNTLNNVLSAIKTLMATLKDDIVFDTNEEQIHNVHFANGCYELNNNIFRPRTKDDYVSMTLSWDYNPDTITSEIRDELFDSVKKIEPCPERRTCLLSYLAYCLSGDTGKQQYINLVGYTAANGKSHTFKMMSRCFEFYTKKLSSDIFNLGNEMRHKEIIHLYKTPVRFAYIEELDNKKKLDAEYMKDIVDGTKVPVRVLYGTSVDVQLQAKIITSSNSDANIKMDEAILRRMVNIYLTSQFLDIPEDDWENRRFKRKDGMEKMFNDDAMKNAVFELLTKPEYKEFIVPECIKIDTKDTADILNEFKNTFEAHFEITQNPEHFVNQKYFMEVMKIKDCDKKKTRSELKRLNVIYNSEKKLNGVKGCFMGLRQIAQETDGDGI
mgnify:FL=1